MPSTQPLYLRKPITKLYEDSQFIVFDKPAGILVIPTHKDEPNTLTKIVNHQYALGQEWRLHPCHRLDRETSGVIIYAKGKHHQQLMMDEFKRHTVHKIYIAFIQGRLNNKHGTLKAPIGRDKKHVRGRNDQGQWALTRYSVKQNCKGFSVVEVYPMTGRTNQIRIHFAQIGHPIVGDRKFSFARDYDIKFRRTALHAAVLNFQNPVTHQKIEVTTQLPKDMEVFLGRHTSTS